MMMLGTNLVMSRMSRTEMVTRAAVRRLLKSLVFLFLMTITKKSKLRKMARTEIADQVIHHQVGLGITLRKEKDDQSADNIQISLTSISCRVQTGLACSLSPMTTERDF